MGAMEERTRNMEVDEEKQEKPSTFYIENTDDSPIPPSPNLRKERTLEGVDITNRGAFKGDDSDGRVTWNLRTIFAAIFLASLYTGK